jgi:TonB family protein
LEQEYPNLETTRPQKIAGNYPPQAQTRGIEGDALVGVLVNSQGEIVDGPRLLVTSGSDFLDREALNTIKARSFEATGEPKAYQFEVTFEPDGQPRIASEPDNDSDSESTAETQTSEIPQEQEETRGDRASGENEQKTDLSPIEREFANWVEGVKNSFPNLEAQRAKLPATYPETIAAKKPPHQAVFFVLVDTDGTIAVKPRQVTQTGNQELDRLALDAIQKAADNGDLPETETPRAYYLVVEFQPPQSTQTEEEEKPQDTDSETPSPDADADNPDEPEESNDSSPQSQDTSETESDPKPTSPSPSPTPSNNSQPQDESQPQQPPATREDSPTSSDEQPQQQQTTREQSPPPQPQGNSQSQQQPATREQSNPEDNLDRPSPSPTPTPNTENSDSETDSSEMEETPEPEPEN